MRSYKPKLQLYSLLDILSWMSRSVFKPWHQSLSCGTNLKVRNGQLGLEAKRQNPCKVGEEVGKKPSPECPLSVEGEYVSTSSSSLPFLTTVFLHRLRGSCPRSVTKNVSDKVTDSFQGHIEKRVPLLQSVIGLSRKTGLFCLLANLRKIDRGYS